MSKRNRLTENEIALRQSVADPQEYESDESEEVMPRGKNRPHGGVKTKESSIGVKTRPQVGGAVKEVVDYDDSEDSEGEEEEEEAMSRGKNRGGARRGRQVKVESTNNSSSSSTSIIKGKKRVRNNASGEDDYENFEEFSEEQMRENEEKGEPMLSMALVRRLMRVNPKVENISSEAVAVTAKATELFLKLVGAEAGRITVQYGRKQVKVTDLIQGIQEQDFDFLQDAFGPKLQNTDSDVEDEDEADSDELGVSIEA